MRRFRRIESEKARRKGVSHSWHIRLDASSFSYRIDQEKSTSTEHFTNHWTGITPFGLSGGGSWGIGANRTGETCFEEAFAIPLMKVNRQMSDKPVLGCWSFLCADRTVTGRDGQDLAAN